MYSAEGKGKMKEQGQQEVCYFTKPPALACGALLTPQYLLVFGV